MDKKFSFSTILLFLTYLLVSLFLWLIKINNLLLIIPIILIIVVLIILKINYWKIILICFVIGFFLCLYYFLNDSYNLKSLLAYLNKNYNFDYFKNISMEYIANLYSGNSLELINIIIFNTKNYDSDIMNNIINLNILHLFVLSGLHLNFVSFLFDKLFKKKLRFLRMIKIFVILLLCYYVDFGIGSIRALITIIISIFTKNCKYRNLKQTTIVAFIFSTLFINDHFSIVYLLSFNSCFIIAIINDFFKVNKSIKTFLILFILIIFNLFIIISINNSINLLSIFSTWIFSNYILVIFIFLFTLMWMPFMVFIITFIIQLIVNILNIVGFFNQNIFINDINKNLIIIYYELWIFWLVFFLKKKEKNSKIIL